jgi:uncharacterized protein (TIGR02453 family)
LTERGAPSLSPETFRFLRALGRNNRKDWMDKNRERYTAAVAEPLRQLVAALAPGVLALDPGFDTRPRFGATLSRINRDIRFAKDKTPYRTRVYVQFARPASGAALFVGVGEREVTAGFRAYGMSRDSPLRRLGPSRAGDNPDWLRSQARRLGRRRYESYWYLSSKGGWTRREGFPSRPDDWERLCGWVVRRPFAPGDAARSTFPRNITRVFEDVFPLFAFTSLED